jgi:hypothetical protein
MAEERIPAGAAFAFDVSKAALAEQLRRLEALDTKAGILLAADGVLAGLFLGSSSTLRLAPKLVAVAALAALIVSMLLSLLAFGTRRYQLAPHPEALIRFMARGEGWLKWRFLGNLIDALDRNRDNLVMKARLLGGAVLALIASVGLAGGYFLYATSTR